MISEGVSQVDSEEEWKPSRSGSGDKSMEFSPPAELKPSTTERRVLAAGDKVPVHCM